MSEIPSYTISAESVTVVFDGRPTTVKIGARNFQALREALFRGDWAAARKSLGPVATVTEWARGRFSVRDNRVIMLDGAAIPAELNERIIEMAEGGENPGPLFKFWERLADNPSHRSVSQLWRFLQQIGIPLTEDGCFLAYKSVKHDYRDVHSGTFDNRPGTRNRMPRNRISDDPNHACHEGLHVGSLEYARSFGGSRIVICKVNPKDVVCIPYDCDSQKMRVCDYTVVGNHGEDHLPSTTIKEEELPPKTFFLNERQELQPTKKWKSARPKGFLKLDGFGPAQLMEVSMDGLRSYASKGLQIVGASRIKGGKEALVDAICRVRLGRKK